MEPFKSDYIVMGYYLAAAAHGSVLLYLLGHPARNRMKRWLCFWEAVALVWNFSAALVVLSQLNPTRSTFLGLPFSYWGGVAQFCGYVNAIAIYGFAYSLMERKADWVFRLVTTVLLGAALYAAWHPTLWQDQELQAGLNGTTIIPALAFVIGLLVWTFFRSKADRQRRMRIIFMGLAVGGAVLFYVVLVKIVNRTLGIGIDFEPYVLIFNGVYISIMVLIAAVRYGIVSMQLDETAEGMFTQMSDPVLLLSPVGRIMRVNPQAREQFAGALAGDELPHISAFIDPRHLEESRFETTPLNGQGDGTFVCSLSKVLRGDEDLGSILIMRDVTKEREVDRMKTEFTSTVSHELRTPLTSVLGFARIIQKRFQNVVLANYAPEDKKEVRAVKQIEKNLDVIISESKRLTALINDVLDISKIEAGKIHWNEGPTLIDDVLEQAIHATAGLFGTKPVELEREIADDLPQLHADGDRLVQVVINLISNAVKFTDEGTVTVAAHRVADGIRVRVTDTGTGIAEADTNKVFEKYRQVGDVLTDKPQGTGLGLPISKEIVEHHGGRIWVESTLGEGTSMIFELPSERETD